MDAVAATAPEAGVIGPACAALGLSRASFHRRRRAVTRPAPIARPPPTPARALATDERRGVLDLLNAPRFIDQEPVSCRSAGAAVDFGPKSNAGNLGAIQADMAQAGFVWGGSFRTPDARHYQSQPAGTSPSSAMVQASARAGG
jgi:hypothetical protein